MNKQNSESKTQASETSIGTKNYLSFNTLSIISSQSKYNIEQDIKNLNQKPIYQLNSNFISKNNKKDLFLDEDDIKNNENFKIFLDNLLTKEESKSEFVYKNNNIITLNDDNSSIHSNKKFFLRKLSKKNNKYKTKIMNDNSNQKDGYISYSLRDNKIKNKSRINNDFFPFQYKLKYFLSYVPKKDKKQINDSIENKCNKNIYLYNNNFEINNNFLKFLNTEKKNIGIDCRTYEYFDHKNKRNKNKDEMKNLTQTFSLKEFDGRMLNKLYKSKKTNIKKKNKNNSFGYMKKLIPDYKIPRIIFFSRNNEMKEKKIENKINTIKENAIRFLKDKSQNNLFSKNSYTYYFKEKTDLNLNNNSNNILLNQIYNAKSKYKLIYGNERNIIPYLRNFGKNYKKEIKKSKTNIKNKKNYFSSFKKSDNNYMNIKCLTINNNK